MKKNNKKGFTLVELVIVVAVMAILVAVAIPTVSSITSTAQTATDKSNARTIESMIKLEVAEKDNNGTAVSVDATFVKTALTEAKLGIESGTFYYIGATGEVAIGDSAPEGTTVTITYDDGVLATS